MLDDINSIESESAVIATLFHYPDFYYECEDLLPNHFYKVSNQVIYGAMIKLFEKGIENIDALNLSEQINSDMALKRKADGLITLDKLKELEEMSDILLRHTPEEYRNLALNVIDTSFRRDALQMLRDCEHLCEDGSVENIREEIYNRVDDVLSDYTSVDGIPMYGDVVDDCWEEIQERAKCGYAGIPFKFKTLNEFATIEKGELFIFAAEAKQGKSMMLLNCAVSLLKGGYSVVYLDSELNDRLFTSRMLSHLSRVEYKNLTSGKYTDEQAEEINQWKEWLKTVPFIHKYIPMFDQQTIYTTVKKANHMFNDGLDVVIVDYFKSTSDGDAYASYAELGRFSDLLKNRICGDMGICGLGAAQATSTGKIADSAKIGRNASTIALIQDKTDEEIANDGEECGNKKMKIILNRNGPQHASGEYIDLWFDGNIISYEEAKQHIPAMPF